jgi:hypothetical protein
MPRLKGELPSFERIATGVLIVFMPTCARSLEEPLSNRAARYGAVEIILNVRIFEL